MSYPTAAITTFLGLQTKFERAFELYEKTALWSRLAMQVESTTSEEEYAFLANLPGIKEWFGERNIRSVQELSFKLKNRNWEESVGIHGNDFRDGKIAKYAPILEMLGMRASQFWDIEMADVINSNSALSWDGQPLFSASHVLGKNTVSNLHTSRPLTQANFETTFAEFVNMVGENGRPLGLAPDALIVPVDLLQTAQRIVGNRMALVSVGTAGTDLAAAAVENPNAGLAETLMLPWLRTSTASTATTWYLAATKFPIKPLLKQDRSPFRYQTLDESSDHYKLKNELVWMVDFAGAVGPGFWPLIHKCTA